MPLRANAKCLAASWLIWGLSGSVRADTYLYTYSGNTFNDFVAGSEAPELTSDDCVTFELETNSIINENSQYSISNAIYWHVDDGMHQLNSDDLVTYDDLGYVNTNSQGQIVSWFFVIDGIYAAGVPSMTVVSCGLEPCQSSIGVAGEYAGDYDQITPLVGSFDYSVIASSPGTWSGPADMSRIPEPASVLTLWLGIGGLWWCVRARRTGTAALPHSGMARKSSATSAITGSQAPGVGCR